MSDVQKALMDALRDEITAGVQADFDAQIEQQEAEIRAQVTAELQAAFATQVEQNNLETESLQGQLRDALGQIQGNPGLLTLLVSKQQLDGLKQREDDIRAEFERKQKGWVLITILASSVSFFAGLFVAGIPLTWKWLELQTQINGLLEKLVASSAL